MLSALCGLLDHTHLSVAHATDGWDRGRDGVDRESSGRRWESGTLAHGVSDPFGQGPLPWLRSPDHYFEGTEDAIPWYVSTDAPGQRPLPAPPPPLVGTPRNSDDVVQQIKGFAAAGVVHPGGAVDLRVTVHPPRDFVVDVYRIGHYAGAAPST